jgi:hypothetical protein
MEGLTVIHLPEVMVLSLDSLTAGLLIGLSGLPVARARLALAFGLCDALGTLLGSAAGGTFTIILPIMLPVLLAVAAAAGAQSRPWWSILPYGLPVLFALDNVVFPAPLADVPCGSKRRPGLAWARGRFGRRFVLAASLGMETGTGHHGRPAVPGLNGPV